MRIYLLGYMGSGKTTLGRKLARLAGLDFIDLDKYIEEKFCRSVSSIFASEGEEGFRKKERKALEEVSEFDRVVVATGGGTPCFFNNMELMNRTGITLFLDVTPEVLARRLSASKTERPLIKGKSGTDLVSFIAGNLLARRQFYEQSKITIDDDSIKPRELLARINR